MPGNYLAAIVRRADSIAADNSESSVLRDMGRCLRSALSAEVPAALANPSWFTMTYVCGNRFTVHNSGTSGVSLTYDVDGTAERGTVAAVVGNSMLLTNDEGTARLYLDGRLIQTAANAHTACQ